MRTAIVGTLLLAIGGCTPVAELQRTCKASAECPADEVCTADRMCKALAKPSDASAHDEERETNRAGDAATEPPAPAPASASPAPARGAAGRSNAEPAANGGSSAGSPSATTASDGGGVDSGASGSEAGASGSQAGAAAGPRGVPGATCRTHDQCESGACEEGLCCATKCGVCERCTQGGVCTKLKNALDDSCNGVRACDEKSACVVIDVVSCSGGDACDSKICEDSVCCSAECGMCETCNGDGTQGTCTPIRGYDDLGQCEGARSCSTTSDCLYVDQQMDTFRADRAITSLAFPYWQVISFHQPGTLVEIRMNVGCNEGPPASAWVEAVDARGRPTGSRLREARIVELPQPSGAWDGFDAVVLEPSLDVRAGDRIAVGVRGAPGSRCGLSTNPDVVYPGGDLYFMGPTDDGTWTPVNGALVFQALVAR